ncbi:MAG: IPT/TIG domain-containing protein [Polyangiaceae bacterium]|nr:IPT/TIG domain-containing protein [Myxococcales bacterium]MCB9585447.1 IPT/TIG domain-containing protein [Polyangiaceae bacterium]MCB9606537.1 IPT/TIG domain-containing protein [Polyangiaceae bacterium]
MTTSYFCQRVCLCLPLVALGCNGIIGPEQGITSAAGGASGASSGGDAGTVSAGGSGAAGSNVGGSATGGSGAQGGDAGSAGAGGSGGATPTGPIPKIFYTDITHAPVSGGPAGGGALVTLYGSGFGSTQGSVEFNGQPLTPVSWGADAVRGLKKVVVQLPPGTPAGAGQLQLVTSGNQRSNEQPLVATNKRIWYATPNGSGDGESVTTPMSLSDMGSVYLPGDLVYLMDGDYDYATPNCFDTTSCSWLLKLTDAPSASEPVQVMGYPGALARFSGEPFGIRVDQSYTRLGNISVRLPDVAGIGVMVHGRNVTLVGNDVSAVGHTQGANSGVAMGENASDLDVVGNYFHGLFGGTEVFNGGARVERYNEFRALARVVSVDPSAPLAHYANHAVDVYQYAIVASGGGAPAKVELFDNVCEMARYAIYQTASAATGEVLIRNNTIDGECLVGSDTDGVSIPVRLEANAFILSAGHACTDEPGATATLTFGAAGNHWGTMGAPTEDASPRLGDAQLDSDLTPGAASALCGAVPKPAAPDDFDYLGEQRRDPTAIGAFECPQ